MARDKTIGAVVFTGAGDHYLTHFDIPDLLHAARQMPFRMPYAAGRAVAATASIAVRSPSIDRALRATPARDSLLMARTYAVLRRLNRSDKIAIAAINGLALGMGCVFSLACDIRVMDEDQHIGLPESALAMLAGAGGTQRLIRMLGTSRAAELLLDGRWLSATEAVDIGLVHRALPSDALLAYAHDLADRLARRSPLINREVKRMLYDAGSRPFAAASRMEAAGLIATVTSAQAERSISAYQTGLRHRGELTDDAVLDNWRPLLEHGVPHAH